MGDSGGAGLGRVGIVQGAVLESTICHSADAWPSRVIAGCWNRLVKLKREESGVGAAVDSDIGSGDVGGFGAGDERDHGSDLFDGAVAIERGGGDLGRGPFAEGGVEIGVDGGRAERC